MLYRGLFAAVARCSHSNNGGCSLNAKCTNTRFGRDCTCLPGFKGNGFICTGKMQLVHYCDRFKFGERNYSHAALTLTRLRFTSPGISKQIYNSAVCRKRIRGACGGYIKHELATAAIYMH